MRHSELIQEPMEIPPFSGRRSRSKEFWGRFLWFLLAAACAMPSGAAETQRPNILFLMADDHAAPAISAYGGFLSKAAPTPHIDRLAEEGMLFRNCFCTNSICTPSRAVIFTGKYSHVNGVYKFTALEQSQPTLPKILRDSGYHTGLVGKYHLHSNPRGLEYWSVLPGQGRYHNPQFIEIGDEHPSGWVKQGKRTTYQGHSSDVIADKALEYLESVRREEEPFVLFCHFKAPHDTWECAARYEQLFADVEIPEPATLFDDYATRSDALKKTEQVIGQHHTLYGKQTQHLTGEARKEAQYQVYIKKYLRCVRGVDDNVGRILEYLDRSQLAENTIVVYTADQGFFLGEHGLYDKRFMYEEALRMPLLIRWPGRIRPESVSEEMVLNLDFAPTLLSAAGVAVPQDMQGKSFLPLLEGKAPSDWRKAIYYRYYYSHFETEPHFGIRTPTHKLIFFNRIKQWELFDLVDDPHELINVKEDPAYAPVAKRLQSELKRLQEEFGDDPDDIGDSPRTGFESE